MSNRSNELFAQREEQPAGEAVGCAFALHALTAALQTAFEAAVFPDWFEIDEQGPGSRTDALTEALILQLQALDRNGPSHLDGNSPPNEEYRGGVLAVTTIIQRIGAATRTRSKKPKSNQEMH